MGPFISIVIPTRNRPEYIKFALESLSLQTFPDFEVVVCDNHTGQDCKAVFDAFADNRFRYVVPETPLGMHDNWEYAVSLAQGQYVSVLIDKTVLRPTAIEDFHKATKSHPADAYSWLSDGFNLTQEDAGRVGPGYLTPMWSACAPEYVDVESEIRRRLSFDVRRGREGRKYYWGKICFGAYSSVLLTRIREATGVVFPPLSPDYTSMAAALRLADRVVDIQKPLMIGLGTKVSNGMKFASDAQWATTFMKQADPELRFLEHFPIKGLYASVHNSVGYDYRRFFDPGSGPRDYVRHINMSNLLLRAREDFKRVRLWPSDAERAAQLACIQAASRELVDGDGKSGQDKPGRGLKLPSSREELKTLAKDLTLSGLARAPRVHDFAARAWSRRQEKRYESFDSVIAAMLKHSPDQ